MADVTGQDAAAAVLLALMDRLARGDPGEPPGEEAAAEGEEILAQLEDMDQLLEDLSR